MNYGPLIFLAAFFALATSWFGLVLIPHLQVGHLQQTNTIPAQAVYPLARDGLAREGLEVYRANGCAYCHSQQVGQTGTVCDVLLTAVGTNETAVMQALLKVQTNLTETAAKDLIAKVPQPIKRGVTREEADAAVRALKIEGVKTELWVIPVGPDMARGWGKRRTVAEDFLYDSPVMLGSQRVGPDLANVGLRQNDANWHLLHLYSPRLQVKDSTMPPYRFLFEKRRIDRTPSPEALTLTGGMAPESGFEVVPKPEAKALVTYLRSLGAADVPLYDAPVTVAGSAPATTNATAEATSTNAAPTNTPAK
jgi:cbb3-type cytochrome oxidase cytochrome c subunit